MKTALLLLAASCAPLGEVQVIVAGRFPLARCAIGAKPVEFGALPNDVAFSETFVQTVQGTLPVFGACVVVAAQVIKHDSTETSILVRITDTGRAADELAITAPGPMHTAAKRLGEQVVDYIRARREQ